MSKKRVLTVDDEGHILELLKYNLESSGYEVIQAETGEEALDILDKEKIDLVLLDLMLPGIDGLEVLKRIRTNDAHRGIPIIMLTAKSEEIDTVLGLEMGADDYIAKPFGVHELSARIKAVFRRTEALSKNTSSTLPEEDILKLEDLTINRTTHEITVRGKNMELPLKEFELLYLLAKNRGRVFDREYLLEKIWGYDYYGETRTVDVHIRNLRVKIEVDDKNPQHIKTVRGVGYKYA
ncbi:response regulator transcription factor [Petrocella sp. FN5]|uniref:response regulator transcription factor n=1 Tax=Petrocella sp. FN5 TaxID=3032002 RepID=UPI0023DB3A01|nr:response regulator transcription factor [Petrocella sp. FN5]MDF1616196.1 response regulator transcription factor [Petrocella sp. FN5]